MKKLLEVTVMYKYENIVDSRTRGLLMVGKNLAFVFDEEVTGVYRVNPTDDPNVWICDLDNGDEDITQDKPGLLLDMIMEVSA